MRAAMRVPAVVLLVVLAVLPLQAWYRAGRADVRISRPLAGLRSVTWAGTVAPDGDLSVVITYDFGLAATRESSIRLPAAARFATANGEAISASVGRYGTVTTDGATLVVSYEREGAVTRFDDGVVLDLSGRYDGRVLAEGRILAFEETTSPFAEDQGLFPCPRCYLGVDGYGDVPVYGALFASDLSGTEARLSGVDHLRTTFDDDAIRFAGVLPGGAAAGLLVRLPIEAAPDAPTLPDVANRPPAASAGASYEEARALADANGWKLREPASGPPIGRFASAVLLTVEWLALVGWIGYRLAVARKALDADAPDEPVVRDALFSPPSALEPAMVGVVVGGAGPGDRSISAATLLNLAHRGVITIDGVDSERYRLTVPFGATGQTEVEEAVLAELRPQGKTSATATFTGPPLWGDDSATVARRLKRVVMKQAHKQRLVRFTLAASVLLPASIAMGVTALIASGGTSVLAWIVTFVGPFFAFFAAALAGVNLTAKGRAERERWVAYGEWLRKNSELHRVGAPGIATWGEPLVYATVLGAAPKAAAALGVQ